MLRAIAAAKRKNDKIDAAKIADCLRCDLRTTLFQLPFPATFSAFAVIGSGAVGCWAAGRLADRWGRTRTTALAMILSGGCALVIGWSALPVAAVLALGVVWGFSVVADSAQFSAMVTEVHGELNGIGEAAVQGVDCVVEVRGHLPSCRHACQRHHRKRTREQTRSITVTPESRANPETIPLA